MVKAGEDKISVGATVTQNVDWERRWDHMQQVQAILTELPSCYLTSRSTLDSTSLPPLQISFLGIRRSLGHLGWASPLHEVLNYHSPQKATLDLSVKKIKQEHLAVRRKHAIVATDVFICVANRRGDE